MNLIIINLIIDYFNFFSVYIEAFQKSFISIKNNHDFRIQSNPKISRNDKFEPKIFLNNIIYILYN